MASVTFIYEGPIVTPRFRAFGRPVCLRWNDGIDVTGVTAHVGELMFEDAFRRIAPRGFAPVFVVTGERQRVFRDAERAFEHWLGALRAFYCENDDCVELPDGRVVDLQ